MMMKKFKVGQLLLRDNEIWFSIILSENLHGKGWGRKVLNELK